MYVFKDYVYIEDDDAVYDCITNDGTLDQISVNKKDCITDTIFKDRNIVNKNLKNFKDDHMNNVHMEDDHRVLKIITLMMI